MDRKCLWATVLVLCCLTRSIVAVEIPRMVGELGSPARIVFHGQQTFTEQQLREGVSDNAALILASHPLADFADFLKLLSHQIQASYRSTGFAKAEAEAIYNPGLKAIVVTIDEGLRYCDGEIEVIGANEAITVDEISQHLRNADGVNFKPSAKRKRIPLDQRLLEDGIDKVRWKAGQYSNFNEPFVKIYETAVRNLFASKGYLDPTLFVELRTESNGTATIVVTVREEGPRALLGSIEVVGNSENSADEIAAFLGIEEGTLITSEEIERLKQKLRSSGRFLKHGVDVILPPFGDGPSVLKIDLYESRFAPPLAKEFPPEQAAMLQISRWLEEFKHSQEDVCVDAWWSRKDETEVSPADPYIRVKAIISPQRDEALLKIQIKTSAEQVLIDSSIGIQSGQLTFDDAKLKARFSMPALDKRLCGIIQMTAHPPNKSGQTCGLQFGCRATSKDVSAVHFECEPVAILEWLGKLKEPIELHGDQLEFKTALSQFSFDATTGHPVNCRMSTSRMGLSFEFREGLYEQALAERREESKDWRLFQPNDAIASSLVAFLSERLSVLAESNSAPALRAWRGTLDRWQRDERFKPLDELCRQPVLKAESEDQFQILNDANDYGGFSLALSPSLQAIDWAVPQKSWASLVVRETIFARFGQASYSDEMIRALYNSPEAGPLAHLTGAYVIGFFNSAWRADLARRGMKKMAIRDFRADYQPFLRDDTPIGVSLKTVAGLLQDCSEDELAMFADLLPLTAGPDRDQVVQSLHHFVTDTDKRWDQQVATVFDELWKPVLKSYVEQWLVDCRSTASFTVTPATALSDDKSVFGLKGDFQGELMQMKAESSEIQLNLPEQLNTPE